jgi:hypothetical protein
MRQVEIMPPTPERVAKGDLNKSRIDALFERSDINEEQHHACAYYERLYRAARPPVSRSCIDIKIGGGLSGNDDFMTNPLHFANLFDTLNRLLERRTRRWLYAVVIEGDAPSRAAGFIGSSRNTALRDFRHACDDLVKALKEV